MAINGSVDDQQLVMPFVWHHFDFVAKCVAISTSADTTVPQITCFDVNNNYFIVGTAAGLVFVFRRHQTANNIFIKYRLTSSPIIAIKLITDDLLGFITQSVVYILNRANHKFLYGWKCPTKAIIKCLHTYTSCNRLMVFSGDSDGCLRYHDLIKGEQIIIFKDLGYAVVQIESIDADKLLVSTSLRTVIVVIDWLDTTKTRVTTIGKNERKTCGKFGAVYSHITGIIYGSRPSMHLIKAQTSGEVMETIRVNNIKQSDCPELLQDLSDKPITGQLKYKLGVLKMLCNDTYILSINGSDLVIVKIDGQFCLRERLNGLIDVKISDTNNNEAFLLFESNDIIRIRDIRTQSEQLSDFEVSSSDSDRSGSELGRLIGCDDNSFRSSTESLINLMKTPLNNMNPISFIDEELRKVFDFNKIQINLTKKYNQLSTSIISTLEPNLLPNCDKNNVFVEPFNEDTVDVAVSLTKDNVDITDPLVITKKQKRKTHYASNCSLSTTISDKDSTSDSQTITVNNTNEDISQLLLDNLKIEDKNDVNSVDNSISEENQLQMILSAYKEANNLLDSTADSGVLDNELITNSIKMFISKDNNNHELVVENNNECHNQSSDLPELSDSVSEQSGEVLEDNNNTEDIIRPVNYEWELIICLSDVCKLLNCSDFISLCAAGYNSSQEIGLVWFTPKESNYLVYYPSLDTPLSLNKLQAVDICCAPNVLYVLSNWGTIYRRDGMDATRPVGNKWQQLKNIKNKSKLISISINTSDSVLWCCDMNGESWTHTIRDQKWLKITDFSSHAIMMKKVCVSLTDSNIVWGIDRSGKIFVRNFCDNHNNQQKRDFCGDNWLLVDGILANDIVVFDKFVIIIVENHLLFRRSAKYGDNDWQQVMGPELCNEDHYMSLSVTQNNDIWIMTARGLVWHTMVLKNKITIKEEDSEWIII
ncbi:uncharacterized protein LOC128964218 [Oppia nitens]|uniref:uncharacterized protein LOC128964218 n=1 Tax=Oppia nitens TaxID=1686743 RepID=UPI0023DA56BD|nr:uncharacterized protein LOC128964218 [Oppia nitens]